MSYKIAVASSDGKNVDLHFGSADSFYIYEVLDDGSFSFLEKRDAGLLSETDSASAGSGGGGAVSGDGAGSGAGCGENNSCGGSGSGSGCGAHSCGNISGKIARFFDCRCVIAAKIGFNVVKQYEKKAISCFDIECGVDEALEKITKYFFKVDNHISLAKK